MGKQQIALDDDRILNLEVAPELKVKVSRPNKSVVVIKIRGKPVAVFYKLPKIASHHYEPTWMVCYPGMAPGTQDLRKDLRIRYGPGHGDWVNNWGHHESRHVEFYRGAQDVKIYLERDRDEDIYVVYLR